MPGMPGWSNWYSNQYSTWNRTRRIATPPYVATAENISPGGTRTAAAVTRNNAAQSAVVIDMGDLSDRDNKNQDTLFGPNIGVVNSGPPWTEASGKEKQPLVDQLTPDVVKGWIAKSKETSQPTTTLQALVNLKRPTLRLSPLSVAPNDDPTHTDSHDQHGLEFEYDCDASKCGIYVHVLLSRDDQHQPAESGLSRILVFETVVDGGFGKILKLEEGALLELGRFERQQASHTEDPVVLNPGADHLAIPGPSDDTPRKSRRFSNFPFRKLVHHEVAGPALAVVDAEIDTAPAEGDKEKDVKEDENTEEGVKVTIRLVALDGAGKPMSSPNEQGTYLHVVRMGAHPAEGEEDTRPWVVKVVKREATIGPHTFHLHEIYGLSSQSSAPSAPTVPSTITNTDAESHTYPPATPTLPRGPTVTREDEPSSECLLCLSSPREVVLLPCRHLVACKDCAMNMVEFGAGGTIVQPEPEAPAAGDGEGAAGGAGGSNAEATGSSVAPLTPVNIGLINRRKRKAKGWFCPVCRQPYTSLLRITTSPPAKEGKDIENRTSTSSDGLEPAVSAAAATTTTTPRGPLASLRPSFLRGMSKPTMNSVVEQAEPGQPSVPSLPRDIERGAVPMSE